jgi:hypothetical protein
MEPVPPHIEQPTPISRRRWWIHLLLVTFYLLALLAVGTGRNRPDHPALSNTAGGLLEVCAVELAVFALVLALAWLASRASLDDLLLRWRGNGMPVLLGAAYSIGLRVGLAIV